MLKTLIKKQFTELFRTYFYDQKKNKARSKLSVIAWFVFFITIMCGVLGGMFVSLSVSLCRGLMAADMSWMYFAVLGLLALCLGLFGSVFNTYSGLYLAKDNDLLLSMPIPIRLIMASRIVSVYLLGLMYCSVVFLPAMIVYWINAPLSFATVAGPLVMYAVISVFVLILSCSLGWVVAKISLKLKNRSFITVFVSLLFIGVYYFFYFKAQTMIQNLLENASEYGEKIRGSAYIVYLFGRIGEADPAVIAGFVAAAALLFLLIWRLLTRGFVDVATAAAPVTKTRYKEENIKRTSVSAALLRKEFGRFTASPNYMLNCGMGILSLTAAGIVLLVKGQALLAPVQGLLAEFNGALPVMLCAVSCMLVSMNDMATPSVSLEGKTIWIAQSLPVTAWQVLKAKLKVQLILTAVPTVFCNACALIVLRIPVAESLMYMLTPLVYALFSALLGLTLGLKMPNLSWTNETVPIKQAGNILIALFSGWGYALLVGGAYLILGALLGPVPYLILVCAMTVAASFFLFRWLKTKGSEIYASL